MNRLHQLPRTGRSQREAPSAQEPGWYAAYTIVRHEKKVAEQLDAKGVELFLPLYSERHRWKDRYIEVHLPLFPGYVFVRMSLADRLMILELSGVVRLVGSSITGPVPVLEEELLRLRSLLAQRRAEPYPYLTVGNRVRVSGGPLLGLEGVVIRSKGGVRFVVSIDLIMKSVAIEVDAADLEPVTPGRNMACLSPAA